MEQKAPTRRFRDAVRCIRTVKDDLRKDVICSSADAAVDVIFDLPRKDVGIRPLCRQNQMDTKSAPLPCDGCQPALHLRDLFFLFFAQAGLIQHLCYLIASKDISGQIFTCGRIIFAQIGAASILEKPLAFLQDGKEFVQQRYQFLQGKAKRQCSCQTVG